MLFVCSRFLFPRNLIDHFSNFSATDLIFGGLSANIPFSADFVPLNAHLWDDITFCFNQPRPIPRWQYLFSVTDSNSSALWLYGMIALIIAIHLVYLFTGFEKHTLDYANSVIYIFGALMNVSLPIRKICQRDISKVLCALAIVAAFLVSVVYNAVFYQLLLNQRYEDSVKSINQIRGSRWEFFATPEIAVNE